ncbi:holin [Microcystis phage Mel-JY34]
MIGLDAVLGLAGKVIDKVIPDPVQRDEARFKLVDLAARGDLEDVKADLQVIETLAGVDKAQIDVNKVDAQSDRFIQYGARPAALWMCVAGLGYTFLIQPIGSWVMANLSKWSALPELNTEVLLFMGSGLLGLGTLRTVDKWGKFRKDRT